MEQVFISEEVKENIKENFGQRPEFEQEPKDTSKKKGHKALIVWLILAVFIAALNIVSWNSKAFSDWYTANIFPFWQNTYGRLTSLTYLSVGEILIGIGAAAVPVSIILLIIGLFRKGKRLRSLKRFGLFYTWTLTIIALVMTFNCTILYHCSSFADINGMKQIEHNDKQLLAMEEHIVDKLNELAPQVARDDNGKFVMSSSVNESRRIVGELGQDYKNLGGYYVKPKKIYFSRFMSKLNTMGVYFPFSMEANYNGDMTAVELPNTLCHELAHTKGYIQEDEANFIAYIASEKYGDVDYKYSSYIYAYDKVADAILDSGNENVINQYYELAEKLDRSVWLDKDSNSDYWQEVRTEDTPVVDAQTISKFSYDATEASLHINGVEDGHKAYGRMVTLMLDYYFQTENSTEMTNAD